MRKNMGTLDRILRTVLAAAVAVLYFTGTISGMTATVLAVLAAVFLLTSAVGLCPLYSLVGLSTCPTKSRS